MGACADDALEGILACSQRLLDRLFMAFPRIRVVQTGYDVPCEDLTCLLSADHLYDGRYCGLNRTCFNSLGIYFQKQYIGALSRRYPQPSYTGLNLFGTLWGDTMWDLYFSNPPAPETFNVSQLSP